MNVGWGAGWGVALAVVFASGLGAAIGTGDPQGGKTVFEEHCAVCHGREAKGDGLIASSLKIRPANLTLPLTQARTDAELQGIIENGRPGTNMRAYRERLGEDDIRDVVAYLRGLAASGSKGSAPPLLTEFAPPSFDDIPQGTEGDVVRYGYEIVTNTQERAGAYVGNALNCRNCHLGAGRVPHAVPFVGLASVYPEYRPRNGRVNSIEDRLDQCFERSLNGRALPPGSREKQALVAYIAWLSKDAPGEVVKRWRGLPKLSPSRLPNPEKGRELFAAKCVACHGPDGQGTPAAPPLWGPRSYTIGAGMARVGLAAAFIKANMPLGQGGTLSDDEAHDLAGFINSRPRPDFPGKLHDWPKGDRPPDVPY